MSRAMDSAQARATCSAVWCAEQKALALPRGKSPVGLDNGFAGDRDDSRPHRGHTASAR
jgi:hypothetical protein